MGAGINKLDKLSLIEFKKVMIASLLENFENFITHCGIENILVQMMNKQADLRRIELDNLKLMGEKIRREREILNGNREKELTLFSEECTGELAASRSQIVDLKVHIVQLGKVDDKSKIRLDQTNQKLNAIITLLQTEALGRNALRKGAIVDMIGRANVGRIDF